MKYEDMTADYGDCVHVTLVDGTKLDGIVADIDLDPFEPANDRISIDAHPTIEVLLSEVVSIS